MQGRMVDIDKLRSSNLETPAVGNMGVNARGDVLGKNGQIIKSKDAVMKQYYETPKGKAQDTTVKKTQKVTPIPQPRVEQVQVMNPTVKKVKPTPVNIIKKAPKKEEPKSGIDAALDGLE